ncbi:pyridoxal 5'-phosphate synthase glutaminase subunit PdxT [Treponema endosymbiont of Eucomonympha sp.]|uniref:pyridoxal 5'-phosphate synthase glutaminase subunit PdxT n=1 Tax=Treponema endosymbiont of Eucomonympha sp. TaxID=1580831 RepID=UPI000AE1FA45|nr:pyridoxal 5'-phosphate synthase glutaminase subunit PdxT [Treponema endosymbiont of Eucomonympha sp.]
MRIGILALQGAVREHRVMLRRLGVDAADVLNTEDLCGIDGLILPGGESTAIGKLLARYALLEPIAELGRRGLPIFGTCAGLILLAKHINGSEQPRFGLMDAWVERNAFGRQLASFEADMPVPALGGEPFRIICIRAPYIDRVGAGAVPLLSYEGKILFAEQGSLLAASFHPELTGDTRIHEYFISRVAGRVSAAAGHG